MYKVALTPQGAIWLPISHKSSPGRVNTATIQFHKRPQSLTMQEQVKREYYAFQMTCAGKYRQKVPEGCSSDMHLGATLLLISRFSPNKRDVDSV